MRTGQQIRPFSKRLFEQEHYIFLITFNFKIQWINLKGSIRLFRIIMLPWLFLTSYFFVELFFRVDLPKKPKKVLKIHKIFFSIILYLHEHHLSMDHISGNKSRKGLIEVPIDREHPDEVTVRVC
jgi:hypothetical protein